MKRRRVSTIFALHVHFSWHGCLTGLLIFPVWRCTSEVLPHCRILFPFETMFIIIEYSLSVSVSLSEQQPIRTSLHTDQIESDVSLDYEGLKICNWWILRIIRSCLNKSLASLKLRLYVSSLGRDVAVSVLIVPK